MTDGGWLDELYREITSREPISEREVMLWGTDVTARATVTNAVLPDVRDAVLEAGHEPKKPQMAGGSNLIIRRGDR